MCEPTTIIMATMAVAGGMKAYGQYKEGVAQNKYYDYLARQSEVEGDYALKIGQKQSELVQDSAKFEGKAQKTKAAMLAGSQKAALAANGTDLSSVTAQDITSDSISKAKLDELAIRFNADSKSWSLNEDSKYKKWAAYQQADQYEYAGDNARASGRTSAINTLLSTAVSMAAVGSGMLGTKAVPGKDGYWLNTPSGTRNMGTWSKLK